MRVLGVDLGKVRIGLAVLDWESGVVTPRPVLSAVGTLAKDAVRVLEVARKEEAGRIVLGLPLEEGVEGKMAGVVRRFGASLEGPEVEVAYVDESLTSHEADSAMLEAGLKASLRKKRLDSEAACLILERYRSGHEV